MFNYRLSNILKGVLCACVIASACGMNKMQMTAKLDKEKSVVELLQEALVDNKEVLKGHYWLRVSMIVILMAYWVLYHQ